MRYAVEFRAAARRRYLALAKSVRLRIEAALDLLAEDPHGPGTAPLRGGPRGRRKCRVGDYRIVYAVHEGPMVVEVVAVGHRSRVYEDAERRA